jgi:hypothetical protein
MNQIYVCLDRYEFRKFYTPYNLNENEKMMKCERNLRENKKSWKKQIVPRGCGLQQLKETSSSHIQGLSNTHSLFFCDFS